MMTHHVIAHPIIENKKSPDILNADRPNIATVKQNTTNFDVVHPSLGGKLDVMA